MSILIRDYIESDAEALANIYYNTIHTINSNDYSEEQVNAWAPESSLDYKDWMRKWVTIVPIVAVYEGIITGFVEFEPNGHMDCFFCHHQFQGQGIGRGLMDDVMMKATQLKIERIYTEASITAKPFFEKMGFRTVKEQTVVMRGVELNNYVMEKILIND